MVVSTHSRPKAAGLPQPPRCAAYRCFNTQPPEGGWFVMSIKSLCFTMFQHTAARRRLVSKRRKPRGKSYMFQHTAARRRLDPPPTICYLPKLFQHTAARRRLVRSQCSCYYLDKVSTHSRPKAAGGAGDCWEALPEVSTHSRPKAAGKALHSPKTPHRAFQHTAARRRLGQLRNHAEGFARFNTQPPEGGWS